MFLPDTRLKKLLASDSNYPSNYAYVYNDGIGLFVEEHKTINGSKWIKRFLHLIPCEIPIRYSNRKDKTKSIVDKFQGRILLRNTSLLINGIKSIDIFQDNISTTMQSMNITADLITITTKDNMVLRLDIYSFGTNDIQYNENDETNTIGKLQACKYLTEYEVLLLWVQNN